MAHKDEFPFDNWEMTSFCKTSVDVYKTTQVLTPDHTHYIPLENIYMTPTPK